jgi:bifunctional non-homologous end joining protein LigD
VVPDVVSWKWEVKARKGLDRLDYTQNAINKTLVAPYSPRPAARAPESVHSPGTSSTALTCDRTAGRFKTVLDRLADEGDPFRVLLGAAQELPEIT